MSCSLNIACICYRFLLFSCFPAVILYCNMHYIIEASLVLKDHKITANCVSIHVHNKILVICWLDIQYSLNIFTVILIVVYIRWMWQFTRGGTSEAKWSIWSADHIPSPIQCMAVINPCMYTKIANLAKSHSANMQFVTNLGPLCPWKWREGHPKLIN